MTPAEWEFCWSLCLTVFTSKREMGQQFGLIKTQKSYKLHWDAVKCLCEMVKFTAVQGEVLEKQMEHTTTGSSDIPGLITAKKAQPCSSR